MNSELNPTEEQAIDALLAEAHAQSAPPDLSREILAQLGSSATLASDSAIRLSTVSRRTRRRGNQYGKLAAVVVALVASVLGVMWIRGTETTDAVNQTSVAVSQENKTPAIEPAAEAIVQSPQQVIPTPNTPRLRPRGVAMVVQNAPDLDSTSTLPANEVRPREVGSTNQAIRLVAQQIDTDLQAYWNEIGIEPTSDAPPTDVAKRMTAALGFAISADSVSDAEILHLELVGSDAAKKIANRWINHVTGDGATRLQQQVRDDLVNQIAESFSARQPLDQTMASLIGGQSPNASAFYSAAASGGHDAMVRRLAMVAMNVDLRCTKCHDALIEGSGRQDAYWSFSNFIQQGVKRSRDGIWSIVTDTINKPSFYELPDGRQKIVEPSVAQQWMPTQGTKAADVRDWSTRLVGSPELARGVVNSLWQMVHGRPLRGHVIDTITAPHHELLDRVEQRLADDLRSSDFDVSRTLALIVASPVSRRSVPDALLTKNALTASDADIHSAMNSVDAFAASMPTQSSLSLNRRLMIAMKSVGGSLDNLDGGASALANIGDISATLPNVGALSQPEVTGYPFKATELPAQWLTSIKSYDSQVDHLGYLAGYSSVPATIREASVLIRKAEGGNELALHRVWWLIKP